MRIKNDKPQNGTASRLSSGERVGAVMAYVLAVTLSVMCVLVAFYAENGYNQIGNAKFSDFYPLCCWGQFILSVFSGRNNIGN